MKTLLAALVLTLLPLAALGQACDKDQHADINCAEGQIWDETLQGCVDQTS